MPDFCPNMCSSRKLSRHLRPRPCVRHLPSRRCLLSTKAMRRGAMIEPGTSASVLPRRTRTRLRRRRRPQQPWQLPQQPLSVRPLALRVTHVVPRVYDRTAMAEPRLPLPPQLSVQPGHGYLAHHHVVPNTAYRHLPIRRRRLLVAHRLRLLPWWPHRWAWDLQRPQPLCVWLPTHAAVPRPNAMAAAQDAAARCVAWL